MDINETLNVIDFGMRHYKNATTGKKMNLLEYYSVTDITPIELSDYAYRNGSKSTAIVLRTYDERVFWNSRPLNMISRLSLFYSIRGYELTPEDKLAIRDKLEVEGFPLMEGIFDLAARKYVSEGIEAISKSKIRDEIITSYNEYATPSKRIQINSQEKQAVLIK